MPALSRTITASTISSPVSIASASMCSKLLTFFNGGGDEGIIECRMEGQQGPLEIKNSMPYIHSSSRARKGVVDKSETYYIQACMCAHLHAYI